MLCTIVIALGLILVVFMTGRGWAAEAFQTPRPGRVLVFPRDHGAHPEYKTEWWYYVGHLKAASGEAFGYQLTFFRAALRQPDPQGALGLVFEHHLFCPPGRYGPGPPQLRISG